MHQQTTDSVQSKSHLGHQTNAGHFFPRPWMCAAYLWLKDIFNLSPERTTKLIKFSFSDQPLVGQDPLPSDQQCFAPVDRFFSPSYSSPLVNEVFPHCGEGWGWALAYIITWHCQCWKPTCFKNTSQHNDKDWEHWLMSAAFYTQGYKVTRYDSWIFLLSQVIAPCFAIYINKPEFFLVLQVLGVHHPTEDIWLWTQDDFVAMEFPILTLEDDVIMPRIS